MHMLRSDDQHFNSFGEIYFSCVFPSIVKGWHIHQLMTLNYAVVYGQIRLVCYDDRDQSPTKGEINEFILGPESYHLIIIPPLIWNGFIGLGSETSIVANCATHPHDPDEIQRTDPYNNNIPYDWKNPNSP